MHLSDPTWYRFILGLIKYRILSYHIQSLAWSHLISNTHIITKKCIVRMRSEAVINLKKWRKTYGATHINVRELNIAETQIAAKVFLFLKSERQKYFISFWRHEILFDVLTCNQYVLTLRHAIWFHGVVFNVITYFQNYLKSWRAYRTFSCHDVFFCVMT